MVIQRYSKIYEIIIFANYTDYLTWLKAAIVTRVPIKSSFYLAIIAATFQSSLTIAIRVTITFIYVTLIVRIAARISSRTSYNYKNRDLWFQVQSCKPMQKRYKLIFFKSMFRFLPGQGSSLHFWTSDLVVPSIVQSSPPCILVGLSQFLVRVWLAPPHVTGHDSHAFQLPHPPLTFER